MYAERLDAAASKGIGARDAAHAQVLHFRTSHPTAGSADALRKAHALEAGALLLLVRCARRSDRIDQGLTHVYAGIAAAQAAGDARMHCQLHAQYVHLLVTMGQSEEALKEAYEGLRMAEQSGDAFAQACVWQALGHVRWGMQQWTDGHEAYRRSLTWAQACNHLELIGEANNGIAAMEDEFASMARSAGRLDEALEHQRRCGDGVLAFIRSSQQMGDRRNTWYAEHNYACFLLGCGDHEAARALMLRHLDELKDGEGADYLRLVTLHQLGDIDLAIGAAPAALAQLTQALALSERLQMPTVGINVCLSLANACEKLGDLAAALTHHRRYHALYLTLASNKAQAHARAIAVKFETEKAKAVAAAQRQRADLLESANTSLTRQAESLERATLEDALTGIANRRRFDQAMRDELSLSDAIRPYSMALVDIDHFKRINDNHSHQMGDEVLRRMGAILAGASRREDLVARYGGEEFVLILHGLPPEAVRRTCERLRVEVESDNWSALHPDLHVTVSIGVAHHDATTQHLAPAELLALADSRLYEAKRGGRNRVVDHGPVAAGLQPHSQHGPPAPGLPEPLGVCAAEPGRS